MNNGTHHEPGSSPRRGVLRAIAFAGFFVALLTGAYIYAFAFSRPGWLLLAAHVVVGTAVVALLGRDQREHLARHGNAPISGAKVTGYVSLFALPVVMLSGLALTLQVVTTPMISFGLDLIHFAGVLVLLVVGPLHLLLVARRRSRAAQSQPDSAAEARVSTLQTTA